MPDPTTAGYEAEPTDVDAYLDELDDWGGDPLRLYVAATALQVRHQAVADAASMRRAQSLAAMHAAGMSYAQIAAAVGGLTRARVQQIVERGRK